MFLFNTAKMKKKIWWDFKYRWSEENNIHTNLLSLPQNILRSTVESIYLESELVQTIHEDWVYYRSIDKGDKRVKEWFWSYLLITVNASL